MSKIPSGIVEVDVEINSNGGMNHSAMFAGHMAYDIFEDGMTFKPTIGWAIAYKPSPEEVKVLKEQDGY